MMTGKFETALNVTEAEKDKMLMLWDGEKIQLNINKSAWHYAGYSQVKHVPSNENSFNVVFER